MKLFVNKNPILKRMGLVVLDFIISNNVSDFFRIVQLIIV